MQTQSVDLMLSKPGIYVVVTSDSLCFCEVEPGGVCHQLRLHDFARDGVLRPGIWNLEAGATLYGPLARATP